MTKYLAYVDGHHRMISNEVMQKVLASVNGYVLHDEWVDLPRGAIGTIQFDTKDKDIVFWYEIRGQTILAIRLFESLSIQPIDLI